MPYRYRDTKTGRFVSKSTYKRSKAHGGTRYKQVRQRKREAPEKKVPPKRKAPPPKRKAPLPITITRRQYKRKDGKVEHIEIRSRGAEIISVRVGKNEYTRPEDIAALSNLLDKAT